MPEVTNNARPASLIRSSGCTALISRQFAVKFTSSVSWKAAGEMFSSGPSVPSTPALPINPSSRPNRSSNAEASRSTAAPSRRSSGISVALCPVDAAISSSSLVSAFSERAVAIT